MTDWTPLTQYCGLLDLLQGAEQHGPKFILDGVRCSFTRTDNHQARFEADGNDFGLIVVCAGWYGDYSTTPIHLIVLGSVEACFHWLPLDPDDKLAVLDHLPLDDDTKHRLAPTM